MLLAIPHIKIEDLEPIGLFATLPFLIACAGRCKVRSTMSRSLAAWSKTAGKPPVLAHWGKATVPTLSTYRIGKQAGFKFNEVAYTTVDASQLLNKEADLAIVPLTAVLGNFKSGETQADRRADLWQRMSELPDLKTVREQGIDFDVAIWTGLFAPKNTPDAVIAKLNVGIDDKGCCVRPEVQAFSDESGMLIYCLVAEGDEGADE